MPISDQLIERFHQTPVSSFMNRTPVVNAVARKWWIREQTRHFHAALSTLQGPVVPATPECPAGLAKVPTEDDAQCKLPDYVAAGEAFSDAMGAWCSTSKFQSVTQSGDSHGYQDIYAPTLAHLVNVEARVLEIGIGVNDPGARSGMGRNHQPGASLRGWSHYLQGSEVHGADVDRRVLVDAEEYTTHFVDQRDLGSLHALAQRVGAPLDLIVDDGLHTPEANGNVISALLPLLSPSGVMVIEDIPPEFDALWGSVGSLIPSQYQARYFPSTLLRQFRGVGAMAGIAVITRLK